MIFEGWKSAETQFQNLIKQVNKAPAWSAFIAMGVGIMLSFLPTLLYGILMAGLLVLLITSDTSNG